MSHTTRLRRVAVAVLSAVGPCVAQPSQFPAPGTAPTGPCNLMGREIPFEEPAAVHGAARAGVLPPLSGNSFRTHYQWVKDLEAAKATSGDPQAAGVGFAPQEGLAGSPPARPAYPSACWGTIGLTEGGQYEEVYTYARLPFG